MPKRGGKHAGKRQEALRGWLFAAPVILLLTVFVIAPFFFAIGFSFTNQRLISPNPTEFVGLRNYKNMMTMRFYTLEPELDPNGNVVLDEDGNISYPRLRSFTRNNPDYPKLNGLREVHSWQVGQNRLYLLGSDVVFVRALLNTLLFVMVVAPLQGGLALLLALLINKRLPGINIFRTIYFMPVVISMVVIAMLWRFIYDGNNGLLNSLISFISFGNFQGADWLGNPSLALGAILAMSVWQSVGFHMIIWLAGLQTIPSVLYEAASTEGANGWQKFRHVTWPGLRNTAVFILIIITMQAFGLFVQVDVMTNGGPLDSTQSLVFQSYVRGFQKQDIAGGSAISVLLFLIVIGISLFQAWVTRDRQAS
jgi:multiple sugar transport system permease protein|tara:strand:+ start:518 stop:1615 length:1098 start_codon:yes stop_codon:yes gene_type:complete